MSTVTGTMTVEYTFDEKELKCFVCNPQLTPQQVQEVADVLASNVEVACEFNDDGTVAINADNFNDSFEDMLEELVGQYKHWIYNPS